jgi:hypothetical protein
MLCRTPDVLRCAPLTGLLPFTDEAYAEKGLVIKRLRIMGRGRSGVVRCSIPFETCPSVMLVTDHRPCCLTRLLADKKAVGTHLLCPQGGQAARGQGLTRLVGRLALHSAADRAPRPPPRHHRPTRSTCTSCTRSVCRAQTPTGRRTAGRPRLRAPRCPRGAGRERQRVKGRRDGPIECGPRLCRQANIDRARAVHARRRELTETEVDQRGGASKTARGEERA